MPLFRSVVAFLFIFLAAGCAALGAFFVPDPLPLDEALMARGIEVYRANYCGACHTLNDAGARGTFGPSHDREGISAAETIALSSYTGSAITSAGYIRESIVDPSAFYSPGFEATNHHMPAFSHLTEADLDALVYLLVNQPH